MRLKYIFLSLALFNTLSFCTPGSTQINEILKSIFEPHNTNSKDKNYVKKLKAQIDQIPDAETRNLILNLIHSFDSNNKDYDAQFLNFTEISFKILNIPNLDYSVKKIIVENACKTYNAVLKADQTLKHKTEIELNKLVATHPKDSDLYYYPFLLFNILYDNQESMLRIKKSLEQCIALNPKQAKCKNAVNHMNSIIASRKCKPPSIHSGFKFVVTKAKKETKTLNFDSLLGLIQEYKEGNITYYYSNEGRTEIEKALTHNLIDTLVTIQSGDKIISNPEVSDVLGAKTGSLSGVKFDDICKQ